MKITDDDVVRAQAHVIGRLNEIEAVLTGWTLGYDRETVERLVAPLYEMCDTDTPPSIERSRA